MKEIQNKINNVFKENFGYTPLSERLLDIQNEFLELIKWQDVKNLKEEAGDLLSSLLQLCNESEWDAEELIENTITKINKRTLQYKTLGRKVKVAILGGAFNPIHNSHIELAKFVLNTSGMFDEVWLMPAYSHMLGKHMESPDDRLEMCKLAAEVDGRIKVCDFEIKNKLAGETFNLFKRLKEESEYEGKYNFSMIIGLDNANSFDKWVNFQELERMVRFVVVPRKGIERNENVVWYLKPPHIFLKNDNSIDEISSTDIRFHLTKNDNLCRFKAIDTMLHPKVLSYIYKNKLYTDKYVKCYDKFEVELKEGDIVDVQKDGEHKIYKKDDGQLYFKPYGKEDRVSAYFANDLIKVK